MLQLIISSFNHIEQQQWVLDARVWNGKNTGKVTSQIPYDFSQKVSDYTTADASIVNVKSIRLETQYRGKCTFSSIDMMKGTVLKNALFVFDVDIQVPKNCQNVEVSFVNSISGQLENISLTGSIRIATEAGSTPNFKLSKLGGHIFNKDKDFLQTSYFTNLTYFINRASVNSNSTDIKVYDINFDGVFVQAANKIVGIPIKQVNLTTCSGPQNITITEAASEQPSLVYEWYEQRLDLLEWKQMHSKYFYMDFDSNGDRIVDVKSSVQRAYYGGNTSVIIFFQDGTTLECPQFYDSFEKTCKTSCSAKIYGSFCLKDCSGLYAANDGNNNCYTRCPTDLGFVLNGNLCTKCQNSLAVDFGQCTATPYCPANYIPIGLGCYPEQQYPTDFTIDTCSTVCEPNQVMDKTTCGTTCSDGSVKKLDLRVCVECSSEYNGGKYWTRSTQSCSQSCQYYNGTFCEDLGTITCPYFYVLDGKNMCTAKCDSTFKYLAESEKKCYDVCPPLFSMTDPVGMTCVASCPNKFYNVVSGVKTCLPSCDLSTSFKAIEQDKSTTDFRCESSCAVFDSKPYSDNRICVPSCPQDSRKFVLSDNITCSDTCQFYTVIGSLLQCVDSCSDKFNGIDIKYDTKISRCEINCSLFSSPKFTQDNTCTDECSGTKPYYITGNLCVSQCYDQVSEKFLNEASNQCVSTCASQTYSRNNANQFLYCSPSACDAANFTGIETFHASYTRCEASCALFADLKYSNGHSCVKTCPGEKKYFDAKLTCYESCPSDIKYAEQSNLCVEKCMSGNSEIAPGPQVYICVGQCDKYFININGANQCVDQCADQQAKKFVNTISKECVESCPNLLYNVVNESNVFVFYCQQDCDSKVHGVDKTIDSIMERCEASCSVFGTKKFTEDNLCVDKCSSSKPYSTPENNCVTRCIDFPNTKFVDQKTNACVKACEQFIYRIDSVSGVAFCEENCDSGKRGVDLKYDGDNFRCEINCSLFSSVKFTQDGECLDKCGGSKSYFITGNLCVSQCYDQVSEKFLNEASNQCVSTCASQTYSRNNANQFLYCSPSACDAANFTGIETFHASYTRCEASCALFADLKYSNGHSCVKTCPGEKKYFDTKLTCYESCPASSPYTESNNTCVTKCASGNYSITEDFKMHKCEGICPKYSFMENESGMRICVSTCKNQPVNTFINFVTQECVPSCEFPFYNVIETDSIQCLPNCNSNFHGIDSTFNPTMERCESSCLIFSSEKYTMDHSCLDKCDQSKPYHSVDRVCVSQCYDQASLKYIGEDNKTCVSGCSFYKQVGLDTQCQSKCSPFELNFSINDMTFCFQDCFDQHYSPAQNACVDTCPGSWVSFSKLCVQQCPDGYQNNNKICTLNKSSNNTVVFAVIGAVVSVLVIIIVLGVIYKKRKGNKSQKVSKISKAGKDTMYYARRLNMEQNKMKLRQQQHKKAGMKVEILDDKNTQNFYVEMKNSITQQLPPIKRDSIDSIRNSVKIQLRKTQPKSGNSRKSSEQSNSMDQFASMQSNRNSISDGTTQQHQKLKQVKPKLQTIDELPVW
ncbi:Conserved_hypothetical protein [Hexamita inflata]|uniref:Uncharacterized protein n=1 Tax=Hexamita inflata TaxID=28002 RepID=A0AA86P5Z6_9EUKA|nr:Conserved hypothetical protein [Hexamita inflata]